MSTLIQLQNAKKSFGDRVLFDNATFAVNEGEHVGIIGPNGAGKTTLFKALIERESLDEGLLTKMQGLRIGYLEQESDWSIDLIIEEYLEKNCIKPLWELKQFGLKLGLQQADFQRPLKELSGGYRMRVQLLSLIGKEPHLLLLDEPTNFLDLETLIVLESFLQEFSGAFLLISHDREFLRRVTDHILEVEQGDLTKFAGNIDDYFEQKAQLQEMLEKQALTQQAKKKSVLDFVNRFGAKATKAKQAQSKLRSLEKMETIELKSAPVRATIQIPIPTHTGKQVLQVQNGTCGYGDRTILKNVNYILNRKDHIGIVGLNGAGKSTLLKSLSGHLPLLSGQLTYGYQVSSSLYSQHSTDQLLSYENVFEAMARVAHPEVTQQDVLNMAGSLLFSGENIKKKIKVLSGGEKSRVALGQILLQKSPLLLLDEPTNHLDFDTVEALTMALKNYEGSLVIVSHDRGFIGRVANKILEVNHGELTFYPGTYDEYVWSLQKGVLADRNSNGANPESNKSPSTNSNSEAAAKWNYKEEKKKTESQIKKSYKIIEKLESEAAVLTQQILYYNELLTTASGIKAGELAKQLHDVSFELKNKEDQILDLMTELEILQDKMAQFES